MTHTEPVSWEGSLGSLIVSAEHLEEAQFEQREGAKPTDGEMTILLLENTDFEKVLRLETLRQPPSLAGLEASLPTQSDIEEAASCLLHLMVRAVQPQVETGLARFLVGFRSTDPSEEPILSHEIYVEPTWTSINLPFSVDQALGAREASVFVGVGTQLQVIDIGNITVRCFYPDQQIAGLPKTSFTYTGRAEDAPWRKVAEQRIDRYRKADLVIKVVDADGQPVPDAEIHVQMTKHAFKFGTTVDARLLAGVAPEAETSVYSEQDVARYRKTLQELFNIVTFDHGMDWASWSDGAKRAVMEEALSWIESLGLKLRGNHLVSSNWSEIPSDVEDERDDPATIRGSLRDRVSTMVGELNGRVVDWDVVDGLGGQHVLVDLLGWDEVDEWFRQARAASSGPKLFLSENGILDGDRLVQMVITLSGLIERNVPLDAVGIKGHFNEQPPPIPVLSDRLDQLASFDLPIMITEFDIDTDDPMLRADFTRDLMVLAFSHPSVEGFVLRRFWAGLQAEQDAAMYRRDWAINPNGDLYRDLVLSKWWTDDVALSNIDGELQTRGFLGDYIVTVRKNGLSTTSTLTLGKEGESVRLELSKPSSG